MKEWEEIKNIIRQMPRNNCYRRNPLKVAKTSGLRFMGNKIFTSSKEFVGRTELHTKAGFCHRQAWDRASKRPKGPQDPSLPASCLLHSVPERASASTRVA